MVFNKHFEALWKMFDFVSSLGDINLRSYDLKLFWNFVYFEINNTKTKITQYPKMITLAWNFHTLLSNIYIKKKNNNKKKLGTNFVNFWAFQLTLNFRICRFLQSMFIKPLILSVEFLNFNTIQTIYVPICGLKILEISLHNFGL